MISSFAHWPPGKVTLRKITVNVEPLNAYLDFNLINKPITGAQILSITRSILNGSCEYLTAHKDTAYEFKLFISGRSVHTAKIVADIKGSLKASLPGRYTLDIIDVIEKPDLAYEAKVMMTPTLIKTYPPSVKKYNWKF